MKFLRDFGRLLPIIGRRQYYFNIVLLVMASLVEVGGMAILYPYLEMLLDPSRIHSSRVLQALYDLSASRTDHEFQVLFGVVAIVFVVASGAVGAYSKVALNRFIWNANVVLTRWLYARYLLRPYQELRRMNADTIAKNVLNEVSIFTNGLLVPWSELVSRFIVIAVWVVLLFVVNPVATAVVVGATALVYGAIYGAFSRRLGRMSAERFEMQEALFDYVNSSFRSLKDIKVNESEPVFMAKIERPALHFSHLNHQMTLISQLPRYVIETGLFVGAVTILLANIGSGSIARTIPLMSLYAMAGFRMIPHVQNLFAALARIRFNTRALDVLIDEMEAIRSSEPSAPSSGRQPFHSLDLRNASFSFADSNVPVLRNVSVGVRAGQVLAVVGRSGSGKSTLIEVFLGLLRPEAGELACNGRPVADGAVLASLVNVGYVSQEIVIFEGTLRENICLHGDAGQGDARMAQVLLVAELSEVVGSLPEGLDSMVVEGGKNFSAGQRQRIALARALYRRPDVLILDEATSALDEETERRVLLQLSRLGVAIVMVTHHRRLLQYADVVAEVIGDGSVSVEVGVRIS